MIRRAQKRKQGRQAHRLQSKTRPHALASPVFKDFDSLSGGVADLFQIWRQYWEDGCIKSTTTALNRRKDVHECSGARFETVDATKCPKGHHPPCQQHQSALHCFLLIICRYLPTIHSYASMLLPSRLGLWCAEAT